MRVVISVVAIARRCMQCAVNSHSKLIRDLLRKVKCQTSSLFETKFDRQRDHDLSCHNRITSAMVLLNAVPKSCPISVMPTTREMDSRAEYTALALVVKRQAGAGIADDSRGAIGCGSCSRSPNPASDRSSCAQMENGQLMSPRGVGARPDRT